MNKKTLLILMMLTLLLTACGASGPNATNGSPATQGGPSAGDLAESMQVAIGTIKLDETDNAVTTDQAAELLPLWETLQVLYSSDTAANQEIEALITQIQDTMTDKQTQAITALNLTRQDMMAIMQSQGGLAFGGAQNGNATGNNGRTFGGGGGEFQGPPPDGGGFAGGGGPEFQGQGAPRTQGSTSSGTPNAPTAIDPNRIPTPLVQAVIEYLKKKAGD